MQRFQFFLERGEPSRRGFEKDDYFTRRLHFAFPSVNGINGRCDVRAGSKAAVHQFLRDPLRRPAIGKRAQHEQNFIRHSLGWNKSGAPANPATTEHNIAIVNHRRLAGRNGFLR